MTEFLHAPDRKQLALSFGGGEYDAAPEAEIIWAELREAIAKPRHDRGPRCGV